MNAIDMNLLDQIKQGTEGAARLLCTLARRGKAIERDDPQRAQVLLVAVRTHPLYKGGRLAFDMLEIEDVMLDSAGSPPMSKREIRQVLNAGAHRLAAALLRAGAPANSPADSQATAANAGRDDVASGTDPDAAEALPRLTLGPPEGTQLPFGEPDERPDARLRDFELQASDYIYDYVVLGFLDVAGDMAASPAEPTSPG